MLENKHVTFKHVSVTAAIETFFYIHAEKSSTGNSRNDLLFLHIKVILTNGDSFLSLFFIFKEW